MRTVFGLIVGFGLLASLLGCGGANQSASRFMGNYTGTWVGIADPTDAGTSNWTIDVSGLVTGTDVDPGRGTTFTVLGTINGDGDLSSESTPAAGGGSALLTGRLDFDGDGKLTGILTWQVTPPLQYRYTFTRG